MRTAAGPAAITAALTVVGLVGGPAAAPTRHADIGLTSDTAIFVGGTLMPTPSPTFAESAAELFLQPLGFDAGDDPSVCVIGDGCDDPLQVLSTPQLIQQGHSSFAGAYEIVESVRDELAANPEDTFDADNPLWVFGYSQGATAGSIAMTQLAHDDDIDPDALHFVFIGNPLHDSDGLSDSGMLADVETPDDAFLTTDYTIPNDPVADATSTSELGLLYEHLMYVGLTPDEIADHTESTDGLITNIDISDDFDQFGAWLNAFVHGLPDSGWWDGFFNSAVALVYDAFDAMDDFFGDWMGIDWGDVEETLDAWFPLG